MMVIVVFVSAFSMAALVWAFWRVLDWTWLGLDLAWHGDEIRIA